MHILKKVFWVLLVLDLIGLIVAGINLLPTFTQMVEYGQLMMIVFGVMVAVVAAVLVFEIVAKVFLIRSASPASSQSSGRKGYAAAARLLILFNLCAVIFSLLSAGGEGATLLNQANLYLTVLASAAEVIAVSAYLRTVKKR
jgi:hypothetical protein